MRTHDSGTTLVMGARGSVGRHVLAQLVAAGVPVRASARRPAPGQFPAGVDVVAADLGDRNSLRTAFGGVAQVFTYADHASVHGVIDSARAAGVQRILVVSSGSVLLPTSAGNAITERHREVEHAYAAADDLTVVPIRPLVLATNALWWSRPIRETGAVPLYQPDALTAPVHERDVAAVAVAALTGCLAPAVSGLLTGPARMTQRAQVAAIAEAVERGASVRELSRTEAFAQYRRFVPAEEAEAVLQFLDDAAAGNSPATRTVQQLLGRPAAGFDEWAREHADDFRRSPGA